MPTILQIKERALALTPKQRAIIGGAGCGLFSLSICLCSGATWAVSSMLGRGKAEIVAAAPVPQNAGAPVVPVEKQTAPEPELPPEKAVLPAPAPPLPNKVEFLKHSQVADVDGIKIEIIYARLDRVRFRSGITKKEMTTAKQFIQIGVRITNSTETFLLEFKPWNFAEFRDQASLKDEFGNRYFKWHPQLTDIPSKGVFLIARVDPGKSIQDMIAFDCPIEKASEFLLELPVSCIGRKGKSVIFKIPRTLLADSKAEAEKVIAEIKAMGGKLERFREGNVSIDLTDNNVQDGWLKELSHIDNIGILTLKNTPITNAGLRHIGTLKDLVVLDLSDTKVTDAGMPHLYALPNLKALALFNTEVSAKAAISFRRLRPKCEVFIGPK